MRKIDQVRTSLIREMEQFEIIDCHEHLGPERQRVDNKVDFVNLFFQGYNDLPIAGMLPEHVNQLLDDSYPLEYRWRLFRPYLDLIRYGSYARAAFIALRELYGFDDINDDNYLAISEAMQAANKPGIYNWILREKCNIRCALTQCESTEVDGDLLIPLMYVMPYCGVRTWEEIVQRARELQLPVNNLDDYEAVMEAAVVRWKNEGVVGLKMQSFPYPETSREMAWSAFESLRTGRQQQLPELSVLYSYLIEKVAEIAARHDLVVAVHTGVWGDFRNLDCKHMIPIVSRHPNTRFDIYHAGIPAFHDIALIGKNFANVWLNLAWAHIVSPAMTRQAMAEWLDLVPVNKILAFGGDYRPSAVDKVIGHLTMARENIASVLAERIVEGTMTEQQAVEIAHKWFWDNPIELYGLEV